MEIPINEKRDTNWKNLNRGCDTSQAATHFSNIFRTHHVSHANNQFIDFIDVNYSIIASESIIHWRKQRQFNGTTADMITTWNGIEYKKHFVLSSHTEKTNLRLTPFTAYYFVFWMTRFRSLSCRHFAP